jgi:hypothetical protein
MPLGESERRRPGDGLVGRRGSTSRLRVIGGNPNAQRPTPADDSAKAAQPIGRMRSLGERVAIALLLGVSGYLTLIGFASDYTNFP